MELVEDKTSSEKSFLICINGSGNVVGDNNTIINQIIEKKEKDHFIESIKPSVLFNPKLLNSIIKEINKTRMVVLWGDQCSRNDKNRFARVLAYKLKADNEKIKIQEWLKNTDVPDVPIFLNDAKWGIYILTDIAPQIVQYDLCKILEVVLRQSHFLIITTNEHFDYWKRLTKIENLLILFHELSPMQLYGDEYLALNLVELLYRERKSLPHEIRSEYIGSYEAQKETRNNLKELVDFLLSKNRSIKNVAEKMGSYDDIDRFVRFLTEDENRMLSDNLIDGIIFKITSTDKEFIKWYYNDLEKRDRQLLLGMTLFNGLYENQLFVAIEELVENEWRVREPVLDAFDYEELDKLRNYAVDIIETGEIERKIEIKPTRRRIIFSECWDTQQRLIVSSIQGMMNIVKNSIYTQSLLKSQSKPPITEESIEKLRQLDVPQYILEKLHQLKDKSYSHWFELIENLQDSIGQQAFELFKDKFKILFDEIGFLYIFDDEFREISKTAKKSQLYGSPDKIKMIYRAVGSTLRQIAFESLPLAENALFEYACEANFEMRNLAALSLAQWKNRELKPEDNEKYEQELYKILNRWYKEPEKVFDPFGAGLSKNKRDFLKERKEYYRSTIILAIGYASSHDEPNHCSDELIRLLKDFIPPLLEEETGPIKGEVEKALGEVTAPLLMKYHLAQLHESRILYDLMRYDTAAKLISYELSLTYLKNSDLFNNIIDYMNEICERLRRKDKKQQKKVKRFIKKGIPLSEIKINLDLRIYPQRIKLMSILIATYGCLKFVTGENRLTAYETFQRLTDIFMNEPEGSILRDAVADAVKVQITRDFHNLLNEIKSILDIFDFEHYLIIIPGFYPKILDEKKKLEKKLNKEKREAEEKLAKVKKETLLHDKYTKINEDVYELERHVTKTEQELFTWILKGKSCFRFIGFLAIFGAYLSRLKKEDIQEKFDEVLTREGLKEFLVKLLISPLLFFFGLRIPIILIQLLPTVIILDSIYEKDLKEMLKSWCSKIKKGSIRRLGFAFRSALFLVKNFIFVVIVYLFITLVILLK